MHVGDRVHSLLPSLYAMSQLGEPSEIVEMYAMLMTDQVTQVGKREQFRAALGVIHACADSDVTDIFGYINERMKYVVKMAPMSDILVLGRHLIQHGVTGVLPPLPRADRDDDRGRYTPEFVARDHVAAAVAHLGVSEREAWGMTMTGLVSALRAKYPPSPDLSPGSNAPSIEEHDAALEWHDKVLAKRNKMNG